MATILQRLKDQLKENDIDPSGIQTISQALRRMNAHTHGSYQEVTGDTISECLDNMIVKPRPADSVPGISESDDSLS